MLCWSTPVRAIHFFHLLLIGHKYRNLFFFLSETLNACSKSSFPFSDWQLTLTIVVSVFAIIIILAIIILLIMAYR